MIDDAYVIVNMYKIVDNNDGQPEHAALRRSNSIMRRPRAASLALLLLVGYV